MANAVTREELQERLKALEELRAQAWANYNALLGAIQDCEFWLGGLTAEDAEAKF